MKTYSTRYDFSLADGQPAILMDNFMLGNGDHLDSGQTGIVRTLHADYGAVWGVDFGVQGMVVSAEREGYGQAHIVEYMKPVGQDGVRPEDLLIDADTVRGMLEKTLGLQASPIYLTAPPPKEGPMMDVVTGELTWSPSALKANGTSIRNEQGTVFEHCSDVRFTRGMDGIAHGGERGFIWFDKAESEWMLDLNAGGSVFISEVPEVLDALERVE